MTTTNPHYEDIENFEPKDALFEVRRRFINYDAHFEQTFRVNSDNIETKIEFLFLILNWVGYYPDKFQNDTNKKGFHDASILDSKHAGLAWFVDFVISEDEKFRKKCQACYSFIGSKTKVLSVEEFNEINLNNKK